MYSKLSPRFVSLLVSLLLGLGASQAGWAAANSEDPRFLIHLLDYLAKDYGGAVENGKVISEGEYKEQVEFSEKTLEISGRLGLATQHPDTHQRLLALHDAINQKKSADVIASLAREIQGHVIGFSKLQMAPNHWPSLANGKKIFAEQCSMCHGATGHGDGAAGANLDPKPADFHADSMAETSPFQEFNVIRLGVPGTGMPPYDALNQDEIWDLAFYVVSLRYEGREQSVKGAADPFGNNWDQTTLDAAATLSDQKLKAKLTGDDASKAMAVTALRLHIPDGTKAGAAALGLARKKLDEAVVAYESGAVDEAKQAALAAYLDGVEPVESRIKANDAQLVIAIEESMMAFRNAITNKQTLNVVQSARENAREQLSKAEKILAQSSDSPEVAFVAASAIILREGFEAFLVILALLGVVRASGSKRAALWVHGGWIAAVGLGLVTWFLSGMLLSISGAGRETMEGLVALLAVVVLVGVGFWLHTQTEISRWKAFIEERVKGSIKTHNLLGLASIAFVAVFREAFETVLFLRAVWMDGGSSSKTAMLGGVVVSMLVILVLAHFILRYSVRLPLRRLFGASSAIMAVLAVILTGKGIHALQESGHVSSTAWSFAPRLDLFGVFPTRETILAQVVVLLVIALLWVLGKRPQPVATTRMANSNR